MCPDKRAWPLRNDLGGHALWMGNIKTARDIAVRPAPLAPEIPRERRREDESVQLVLGLQLGLGMRTGHLEGLLAG